MPPRSRKALKQPGFVLPAGEIFSSLETGNRIFEAMMSPDTNPEPLKVCVREALQKLFGICLDHKALGVAVRAGPAYWKVVSNEWKSRIILEPEEVEEVVIVYARARENYNSSVTVQNSLTRVVDQFNSFRNEVRALPPPTQFQLHRGITGAELATTWMNQLTISATSSSSTTASTPSSPPWPPAHFNVQEYIWVTDSRIQWQLAGKNHLSRIANADLVHLLPRDFAYPQDVKLFLCLVALSEHNPLTLTWALFMEPIGFLNPNDRKDWYLATGGNSKMYASIPEFIAYSQGTLQSGTRTTVVGMFSFWPWGGIARWEQGFDPSQHQSRDRYWNENCQRCAIVTVVHKKQDGELQLIIADPFHDQWPKFNQPQPPVWTWEQHIGREIMGGLGIQEMWHGGLPTRAWNFLRSSNVKLEDSMVQASGFIWDVVHDRVSFDELANRGFTRQVYRRLITIRNTWIVDQGVTWSLRLATRVYQYNCVDLNPSVCPTYYRPYYHMF